MVGTFSAYLFQLGNPLFDTSPQHKQKNNQSSSKRIQNVRPKSFINKITAANVEYTCSEITDFCFGCNQVQ